MHLPDVAPVIELKRETTKVIARVQKRRKPLLITERGRGAAVLVDIVSWEELIDRMEMLEGIAAGERDIAAGRTLSTADVKRRLGKWLKRPKR